MVQINSGHRGVCAAHNPEKANFSQHFRENWQSKNHIQPSSLSDHDDENFYDHNLNTLL